MVFFFLIFTVVYVIQMPFINLLIILIWCGIELLIRGLSRLCESPSYDSFFSKLSPNVHMLITARIYIPYTILCKTIQRKSTCWPLTLALLELALQFSIAFCVINLCNNLSFFYQFPVLAIYLGFLFGYNSHDLCSLLLAALILTIRVVYTIVFIYCYAYPTPMTLLYLIMLLLVLIPLIIRGISRGLIRLYESPSYDSFFSKLIIRVLTTWAPYVAIWQSYVLRYEMWKSTREPSTLELALRSFFYVYLLSLRIATSLFYRFPLLFLLAICVGLLFGYYYV